MSFKTTVCLHPLKKVTLLGLHVWAVSFHLVQQIMELSFNNKSILNLMLRCSKKKISIHILEYLRLFSTSITDYFL